MDLFGPLRSKELQGEEQGQNCKLKRNTVQVQDSKKGKKTARVGKKEVYVIKVRSMRRHLKILKERKDLTNEQFWSLYKKVNGAQVRSLSHLRELVRSIRTH